MKERVSILVDGANFYFLGCQPLGLKDANLDFDAFAEMLANGRTIVSLGKRYYIGTVREKVGDRKSKEAMSRQTTLFTRLKKSGWEIKTSKHRTRLEGVVIDSHVQNWEEIRAKGIDTICVEKSREKGIDVKIATDLIVGAVDNQYDTAIVVSSDTDLIPAIDWVRNRYKKKVEYVGFSMPNEDIRKSIRPTLALVAKTDVQRILLEEDMKEVLLPSFFEE